MMTRSASTMEPESPVGGPSTHSMMGSGDSLTKRSRFGLSSRLRLMAFGVHAREATFERRGFPPASDDARRRLERVGTVFLQGYNAALRDSQPVTLARELSTIDSEWQGFAFEGAGMGLAIQDILIPIGKPRWQEFVNGGGQHHIYMMHVGAGWAMARLRRSWNRLTSQFDDLLSMLAFDGCGFHHGYFEWQRALEQQRVPRWIRGYARRAFDQGLGRSLWFVEGTDVQRIATRIASFPVERQSDLWSGVGLACTYAGGIDRAGLTAIVSSAGNMRASVAQGAAFAAEARRKAGNVTPHTEIACDIICRMSVTEAADLTTTTRTELVHDAAADRPAFEDWRQRIQAVFEDGRG